MLYNIFLDISQSDFLCSGTNKFDAVKMAAVSSSFHHENKIRLRHARSKLFITKKGTCFCIFLFSSIFYQPIIKPLFCNLHIRNSLQLKATFVFMKRFIFLIHTNAVIPENQSVDRLGI